MATAKARGIIKAFMPVQWAGVLSHSIIGAALSEPRPLLPWSFAKLSCHHGAGCFTAACGSPSPTRIMRWVSLFSTKPRPIWSIWKGRCIFCGCLNRPVVANSKSTAGAILLIGLQGMELLSGRHHSLPQLPMLTRLFCKSSKSYATVLS